jgi:hypothetical protein
VADRWWWEVTGVEQLAVWLFGFFCTTLTVCSVVKAWAQGRVDVAREHARVYLEVHRTAIEAQHGSLTVPPAWTENES